jgi:hypothetical protein
MAATGVADKTFWLGMEESFIADCGGGRWEMRRNGRGKIGVWRKETVPFKIKNGLGKIGSYLRYKE